jgi:hypothetical protein
MEGICCWAGVTVLRGAAPARHTAVLCGELGKYDTASCTVWMHHYQWLVFWSLQQARLRTLFTCHDGLAKGNITMP